MKIVKYTAIVLVLLTVNVVSSSADYVSPNAINNALNQLGIDPNQYNLTGQSAITDQGSINTLNDDMPDWAKNDIANGQQVSAVTVHFTDEDGNWDHDGVIYYELPPISKPSAPNMGITDNTAYGMGFTAFGTDSTPGDTILIMDASGNVIGQTIVNYDRTWSYQLMNVQPGDSISAVEVDAVGTRSDPWVAVAPVKPDIQQSNFSI
jgi:hypothetical protein